MLSSPCWCFTRPRETCQSFANARSAAGVLCFGSQTRRRRRPTDWAFFFGQDTVAEAIVVPEEIHAEIPTDFGRSKGIAGIISVPLVLCSGRRRRDATGRKRRRNPARVASLRRRLVEGVAGN